MTIISENKLYSELIDFIENSVDEDILMFYNKFGITISEEDFDGLAEEDRAFVREDLMNIIDESFDNELTVAIKFYQIMHCYSFHGVTNHKPPRFKFEEMSLKACEMFLISEGIINDSI